jgi:hypothetical protein
VREVGGILAQHLRAHVCRAAESVREQRRASLWANPAYLVDWKLLRFIPRGQEASSPCWLGLGALGAVRPL